MGTFENKGFLRSYIYNSDEFSQIIFGDGSSIGPSTEEWEDDGALPGTETGHTSGLFYCFDDDGNRLNEDKVGKYRVIKTAAGVAALYFVPKLVVNNNQAFYCYDDSDVSNGLLIANFENISEAQIIPECAIYAAGDGTIGIITNPTDNDYSRPGVYQMFTRCYRPAGEDQYVIIEGFNDAITSFGNELNNDLRIKYSTNQPYSPSSNMLWVFPAQ